MARVAFYASVSGTRNGQVNVTAAGTADEPYAGAAASKVSTDVATLVADGATPTQAHVNTLNTDFTAFQAAATGSVVATIDKSAVTNLNQLKAALDRIFREAQQSNQFTVA